MSFPRKYWARNTRTGEVLLSFFSFFERFRERFKQIGCRKISFSSEGANYSSNEYELSFFGLSSSPWIDNRKKGEGRERESGQCIDQ